MKPQAPRWLHPDSPLRVGISRCLLGDEVRYDGQHKRDDFLTDVLGRFVQWVPVCPEVEVGMGVPREPVQLVRSRAAASPGLRMLGVGSRIDHTPAMQRFAERRARALAGEDLCGYVFKQGSPSCGLFKVKVHASKRQGQPRLTGRGLFADALVRRMPHIPVEEEGRLADPTLRASFIERLFAYQRLRALFTGRWTRGDLVAFHTAHKLALLAHAPDGYRSLGRLVARAKAMPARALRDAYVSGVMRTLAKPATRGRHSNVLSHMAGYLRDHVDRPARAELIRSIDDYRRGLVPLVVPLTLLQRHVRTHHIAYLAGQTYLDPRPRELLLGDRV